MGSSCARGRPSTCPGAYQRCVDNVNTVSIFLNPRYSRPMTRSSKLAPAAPDLPGRGRRARRASGDDRERAILDTLAAQLERRAFHEVSTDDLARGAGLSRSSFYFYFASKEAVLMSLLDRLVAQTDATVAGFLSVDPVGHRREAIAAYVTMFEAHRAVLLAGNEAAATVPEVRALWGRARQAWVQLAAAAITLERSRGGVPEGVEAHDLAYALVRMNEGVMLSSFSGEAHAIEPSRVVDVLSSVWRSAIYGPTGAPTRPPG